MKKWPKKCFFGGQKVFGREQFKNLSKKGHLFYLWLTGSIIELEIAEGRLQNVSRIIYEEDLR